MRSRVVFPAPFAPSKARASPSPTSRFICRRAGDVGRANGWRNARQPFCVGGNHFSSEETEIAEALTQKLITFLVVENNWHRPGEEVRTQVVGWQDRAITGKIIARWMVRLRHSIVGTGNRFTWIGDAILASFGNKAIVPSHVLIRRLDGESVLLNLESERYFGLDATGTRMLDLVTSMPNIDSAYEKLLEEFEVEPALLRDHLDALLKSLAENGLVSLLPADVGTTPTL
jgi:Coenzyme PQQ synthesis protein D (PqqD)